MIYYKHYIGDYQTKTGHLSLAQDGAYRRLMDHYYSTENPLPANPDALYRICGALEKKEREAVDFVSKAFFIESAGQLHHQRIDEEVSIAQEKIANLKENAKAGGKQSGKTRSSKAEANASPNAEAKTNISHKSVTNTKSIDLENLSLPAWLPADVWQGWVDYRKSIKAKLTLKAAELCIAKLETLRADGNDPKAVIEQSIMSGKWTGLFPVKDDKQTRANGGSAPWWSSDALILAKGAEMGMKPHNGEYMPSFKGRVQAAIDNGGKPPPPPRANITTFDDGEKDYKKPEGMPSLKSFVKPREAA